MTYTRRRLFARFGAGLAAAGLNAAYGQGSGQFGQRLPDIILILADDLGYSDLGCYGGRIPTPNIDALAASGARFTNYHTGAAVCTPSRAALLRGRYATRLGLPTVLFPSDRHGIEGPLVPDVLRREEFGYDTGIAGKWHVGFAEPHRPLDRGFNWFRGILGSNDMSGEAGALEYYADGGPEAFYDAPRKTLASRITDDALRFIGNERSGPYFLYVATTSPHVPIVVPEGLQGLGGFDDYEKKVIELDHEVGRIVDELKRRGSYEDTLVLFTSDNGSERGNHPLRGTKFTLNEGGIRVPLIVSWPGRVREGAVIDDFAHVLDVMPTLSGIVGFRSDYIGSEGADLWPLVRYKGAARFIERDRPTLFFSDKTLECAIWRMKADSGHETVWKARFFGESARPDRPELYDIVADVSESKDVAAAHPDVVRKMREAARELMRGFPDDIVRECPICAD